MDHLWTPPQYNRNRHRARADGLYVAPVGSVSPPVAGYTYWLDANYAPNRTSSGGTVSAWVDRAAGVSFTVPGGNVGPKDNVVTLNGRTLISFNATNMALQATLTATNDGTTFYVIHDIGSGDDQGILWHYQNSGAPNNYRFLVTKPSTDQLYGWDGTNFTYGSFPSLTATDYIAILATGSSAASLYKNAVTTPVGTGTWSASGATDRVQIGNAGAARFHIGEVVHYPTLLSAANIALVEAWLGARWAL